MVSKTIVQNRSQTLNLINNFIDEFQIWCNQRNHPELADFEKYLSKKFHLSSNGHEICRDIQAYVAQVKKYREEYSNFDITWLEEPILSENKAILTYEVNLRLRADQEKKQYYVIAIATIEENKVARWLQVTHEKGDVSWG